MSDGTPARYIMRQAMCEFYRGAERTLVDQFIMLEAGSRSDDPTMDARARTIWSFMVALALRGQVQVTGHLERSQAAQMIESGLLSNSQPNFNKQTLRTDAGTFHGVLVSAIDVTPPLEVSARQDADTDGLKDRGGRKPKHDWMSFAAEVVRIGWEDGFTTRRSLTTRMTEWCANEWQDPPDASTIRRQVAKLCPKGIGAE